MGRWRGAASRLSFGCVLACASSCFFGLSDLKSRDGGAGTGGTAADASVTGGSWNGGAAGGGGIGGSAGAGASGGGSAGAAGSAGSGGATCSDPSFGDCDGNASNGCETDLASSGTDCGACGHDCLGGGCAGGKCQPVLLIDGVSDSRIVAPLNLAVDASSLYFTVSAYQAGNGYVMKIPLSGATTATALASNQDFPYDIALDAGYVYWTDADDSTQTGSVHRVAKGGGTDQVLASNEGEPTGVSVDDSNAYWAVHLYPGGAIRKVAKGGGTPSTVASSQQGAYGTVADPGAEASGNVYFTTDADGLLRSVPKTGGTVADLADAPSSRGIATDGTSLFYVLFQPNGEVRSVTKSGQNMQTLAQNLAGPEFIAVDASDVYFTVQGTSSTTGLLERVSKAGGNVEVIAQNQANPGGVAVDASAIYWIEYDGFRIWKLAK